MWIGRLLALWYLFGDDYLILGGSLLYHSFQSRGILIFYGMDFFFYSNCFFLFSRWSVAKAGWRYWRGRRIGCKLNFVYLAVSVTNEVAGIWIFEVLIWMTCSNLTCRLGAEQLKIFVWSLWKKIWPGELLIIQLKPQFVPEELNFDTVNKKNG